MSRRRVAVIGAGISGLTAAYILQRAHDVTLYESEPRLGGHAHTHDVVTPDDRVIPVDSGFIVHNDRTYPHLLRLFAELEVETRPTDMSMSVSCRGCGLEYAGGNGLGGLFAGRASVRRPAFLRMLAEVPTFHRRARRLLATPGGDHITFGEFLARGGYSPFFVEHFATPLVSCVWSCPPETALRYPARYLFRFLDHHGALRTNGAPQWRTVVGGSRTYVERVGKELTATAISTPVRALTRTAGGVVVHDDSGAAVEFTHVVVATHADQALRLLAEPTVAERTTLGAFTYSRNETVLHTDQSLLPRHHRARACWNYRLPKCSGGASDARGPSAVEVSYSMNRLQRLDEPIDYVVTLNAGERIDERSVIARMLYTHPVFDIGSVAAQTGLPALNDGRLAFAGAYHGWGFHEDGCVAGIRAAASLGVTW